MAAEYPVLLAGVTVTTGVNDTIIYHDGAADRTGTIAAGTYFLRTKANESGNLLDAIVDAMDAAPSTALSFAASATSYDVDKDNVATQVDLEEDGSAAWTLRNTGTFDLTDLGFETADFPISSSGGICSATVTAKCAWVSPMPYRAIEEVPRRPGVAQLITAEGQIHTFTPGDDLEDRVIDLAHVDKARAKEEGNTADPNASYESFWRYASNGRRMEFHAGAISAGTLLENMDTGTLKGTYVYDRTHIERPGIGLTHRGIQLYGWSVLLREYIA